MSPPPSESAAGTDSVDDRIENILIRWEAAIKLLYPDEMTPNAKRIMTNIINDERLK